MLEVWEEDVVAPPGVSLWGGSSTVQSRRVRCLEGVARVLEVWDRDTEALSGVFPWRGSLAIQSRRACCDSEGIPWAHRSWVNSWERKITGDRGLDTGDVQSGL